MKVIRYEEVADVSSTYPYIELFFEGENNPFMEIGISDDKSLYFRTYPNENTIDLSLESWERILETANSFHVEALKNEEAFEDFLKRESDSSND